MINSDAIWHNKSRQTNGAKGEEKGGTYPNGTGEFGIFFFFKK